MRLKKREPYDKVGCRQDGEAFSKSHSIAQSIVVAALSGAFDIFSAQSWAIEQGPDQALKRPVRQPALASRIVGVQTVHHELRDRIVNPFTIPPTIGEKPILEHDAGHDRYERNTSHQFRIDPRLALEA